MSSKRFKPDGTVRIATALAVPEVLRRLDTDPAQVFGEAGISQDMFEDPDNRISFRKRAHLLRLCAECTGCGHFGLLVGQRAGLSSLGLIGYLVMNSPNVGSALSSLVHYFHLHAEGSLTLLDVSDGSAFLGYGVYQKRVEATEQITDAAVSIAYNILQQLCGKEWRAMGVTFSHRKPPDTKPYKRFFKAPLQFDAEKSGVRFSPDWLQRSIGGADPELHRLLEKQLLTLEIQFPQDFPEQVRRVVSVALLTKQARSEQVAEVFSIHSRTLHRRLRAHGTSFREIADECRFSIAQQLLQDAGIGQAQIADMLGYSDTRAFSRAFHRWSGYTPSQWRLGGRF